MIVPRVQLMIGTALALPFVLLAATPSLTVFCAVFLGAFVVIALADALVAPARLRGVRLEAPQLVRLTAKKEGDVMLRIQNNAKERKQLRIGIAFPPDFETETQDMDVDLPQDSEFSQIAWKCTPQKRGRFSLTKCYFETRSPLGFWDVRGSSPFESEIRVYPNLLEERKRLAAIFLHRGGAGIHARRMIGQGREFEKLRDYIPGDSFDQIHWKATAKRGKPVTKLFQIERTQEIYCCIDFSRLSAQEQNSKPLLERFLTTSLVLGLVAQQQGDLYGLLTFSDRVQNFLRARSGKGHYAACRDAIYRLTPQIVNPDFNDLCSFIRLRLRRRALLVIVTDLSDPVLSESFLRNVRMIARQHLILVNMIRPEYAFPLFTKPDASSANDLYRRLSGHLFYQDLLKLKSSLENLGISFNMLENEKLAAEIVSQYLRVKQLQLL
jgi:uncharacterized protein (DUF58 family)